MIIQKRKDEWQQPIDMKLKILNHHTTTKLKTYKIIPKTRPQLRRCDNK